MAYNNNVPLATQRIKDTQQPIRDNFAELDTYTSVNHEALNTADAGKHKFVNLTNQVGVPATGATEITLFAATSTLTSSRQLFMKNGAATEIEISAAVGGGTGWALLPSGIYIQWGTGSVTGSNSINFALAFPSVCYSVTATIEAAGATDVDKAVRVVSFNATAATFYVSPRSTTGSATAIVNFVAFGA